MSDLLKQLHNQHVSVAPHSLFGCFQESNTLVQSSGHSQAKVIVVEVSWTHKIIRFLFEGNTKAQTENINFD